MAENFSFGAGKTADTNTCNRFAISHHFQRVNPRTFLIYIDILGNYLVSLINRLGQSSFILKRGHVSGRLVQRWDHGRMLTLSQEVDSL